MVAMIGTIKGWRYKEIIKKIIYKDRTLKTEQGMRNRWTRQLLLDGGPEGFCEEVAFDLRAGCHDTKS